MGFLADFGRSNAYQVGQNLLTQTNQLGQMQIQREQQNLANTVGMIDATAKIQAINQRQQELEELHRTRDVDELLGAAEKAGHGLLTKRTFGFIESMGGIDTITGPDGTVKRRISKKNWQEGAKLYQQFVETNKDEQVVVSWDNFISSSQRKQMAEEAVAGNKNPAQAQALQAALDKAKKDEDAAARLYTLARTGKDQEAMTPYQQETLDIRREGAQTAADLAQERLEESKRHNREIESLRREGRAGSTWKAKPTDRTAIEKATTDAFGQFVLGENDRLLGTKLTPAQIYSKLTKSEKDYKARVAKRAWAIFAENEGQIAASEAVQQAMSESPLSTSNAGTANAGVSPPPGFRDTGRTSGGKKVYSDGKNAWVEP
jgi:hypothetical protein